jgi:hypothetical protein
MPVPDRFPKYMPMFDRNEVPEKIPPRLPFYEPREESEPSLIKKKLDRIIELLEGRTAGGIYLASTIEEAVRKAR